jgi:hypothetical protein
VERVMVFFDSNNDGVATRGSDDWVQVDHGRAFTTDALSYVDQYFCGPTDRGGSDDYCRDVGGGGTNDGEGAAASDGTTATFELSKPLLSGDAHDFNATSGATLGFLIGYEVSDSSRVSTYYTFWPAPWYSNYGGYGDITIVPPATQSIVFSSLPAKSYGDTDFSLTATASSELSVLFSASGKCRVSGARVHITGAGSCTVTASQGGDDYYDAAANVAQTFGIAKATQRITFARLANSIVGAADIKLRASASSGLPVSFAARGRCRASGSKLHLIGVGACTVTASQPGNPNYRAAPKVSRTFTIAPARRRSADGRFITFESEASNLVPGDTTTCTDIDGKTYNCSDVFVRDRVKGTTTLVSVAQR